MYCSNCGKEMGEKDTFCSACGTKTNADKLEQVKNSSDTVQVDTSLSENSMEKSNTLEDKTQVLWKWLNNVKIVFLVLCIIITVVGIVKGSMMLQEKAKEQERVRREQQIQYTLARLGNRSYGSNNFNTVQYSNALGFLAEAALGKSNFSNCYGMDAEEIKKEWFETLEEYFEVDYLMSYAALVFCADYFEKEDVEYFYDGTKIKAYEVRECVEKLLFKNNISLAAFLVNEKDEQICFTLSLRIRLAEDGYMTIDDIVTELYQFVYEDKPVRTIEDELLAEEITYEQIASNVEDSFKGEKLYYEDLSPVGKLVFLYLMPRYVVQFDQEAGSNLWNDCFVWNYNRCWEEIIWRDIFSRVIE